MNTLTSTPPAAFPGRRPSGLVAAFLVAFALHALVLLAVMYYRLSPPAPPGEQQVTVDLSPLMADAPTQAPAEQAMSQSAPPEAKPIEEPTEEPTKPPPPAETAEVEPDEAEAAAPQTQAVVEPPTQVITSTAEQAEPLAPPPPEAARVVEAKPAEPKTDPAKLKAAREAKLKKIREEQRREEEREERLEAIREAKLKAAREARAKQAKAQQGAERRNSAAASRQASAGRAAAGNDPNALAQWKGALSSAIHSRMNTNAAAGTSGGTAVVSFVVLKSGHVASASLSRSSGVGQIDGAALAAVRGTLPAAPPGIGVQSLSVAVPLNFRVR